MITELYIKEINKIKNLIETTKVFTLHQLGTTLSTYDRRAMLELGYISRNGFFKWGGNKIDDHMVKNIYDLSYKLKMERLRKRRISKEMLKVEEYGELMNNFNGQAGFKIGGVKVLFDGGKAVVRRGNKSIDCDDIESLSALIKFIM